MLDSLNGQRRPGQKDDPASPHVRAGPVTGGSKPEEVSSIIRTSEKEKNFTKALLHTTGDVWCVWVGLCVSVVSVRVCV